MTTVSPSLGFVPFVTSLPLAKVGPYASAESPLLTPPESVPGVVIGVDVSLKTMEFPPAPPEIAVMVMTAEAPLPTLADAVARVFGVVPMPY